ncbi:membrane protein [Caulobacter phage CcrPW]|uniref:Inner membrane spanin component n=1 Tax=Caulobacter phage CcrPW TaxID=2283271 RepID=A0A385ECU5_9CAUD|nr:membrane protein [Caulobacter phage CcrPW]AXQ68682.1 hypothetical protein CcrPW_gp143 [Caulobacter phage CcrPW]
MFSILLHMLISPATLWGVGGLALIAVALYFLAGPVFLWKLASDIRTWFAIAAVLAVLAFAHNEKQNSDLKAQIAQAGEQKTADKDAQKTTELRVKQKTARASQTQRYQAAITNATPGTEVDTLLDAIAADQAPVVRTAPPVQGPVPGPAPGGGDGLRKHPDVTVVP